MLELGVMTAIFSALQSQGIRRLLLYWATRLAFDRSCIVLQPRALDLSRIRNVRFWTSCLWHPMFLYLCIVISSRHATFRKTLKNHDDQTNTWKPSEAIPLEY
jgi:hypothetical protein